MQRNPRKPPLWIMLLCTLVLVPLGPIALSYGIDAIQTGEVPWKPRLRPIGIIYESRSPVFYWILVSFYLGFGGFALIAPFLAWWDWWRTSDTLAAPGHAAWAEGSVVSDDGDAIAFPGMSIEENTATVWEDRLDKTGRYRKAVGGPVSIRGQRWRFVAYFHDSLLARLDLVLNDRGAADLADVWAEESFLQAMVRRETGRRRLPAKFTWGSVGAAYDERGGFSGIWFRYKPARKKGR